MPGAPKVKPIRICLIQRLEKRALGVWPIFSPWEAEIEPDHTNCTERLYADLKTQTIYLWYDEPVALGVTPSSGPYDLYCPSANAPCNSSFFTPNDISSVYRLNEYSLLKAVKESGIVGKLALFKVEYEQREAQRIAAENAAVDLAKLEGYRAEAQAATTITPLLEFIKRYEDNDPEGLVIEARARLAKLQQAYLDGSHSSKDIGFFIRTFEREDPAGLVPQAHRKLAKAEAAEARAGKILTLRRRIAGCKILVHRARETIARERQIEAVTGTVSFGALHEAGSELVICRDAIPEFYKQYRAAGGKEPLEAIR